MKNILYIDDNKNSLNLMEEVLKNYAPEINCYCVSNQIDFLDKASRDIDLFLIDYTLEDCLGDELYEQLLHIIQNPKVIIISAGITADLFSIFSKFSHQPISISDRFSAIEIIKKEIM